MADILHSCGLVKHQEQKYEESIKLYDQAIELVSKEFGGLLFIYYLLFIYLFVIYLLFIYFIIYYYLFLFIFIYSYLFLFA